MLLSWGFENGEGGYLPIVPRASLDAMMGELIGQWVIGGSRWKALMLRWNGASALVLARVRQRC